MMKEEIDFLAEIHTKYAHLESDLDTQLRKITQDEEKLMAKIEHDNQENSKHNEQDKKICSSLAEAKKRNEELLKSFDIAKARLRLRSTYTPLETILQKAKENYKKSLMLPQEKKVYGPFYV